MDHVEEMQVFDYFYVARQPIFNSSGEIWGYELFFRSGPDKQSADITNADLTTLCVATCGFVQAQEYSDSDKKTCINFTDNLLLKGAPRALPPSGTVIEISETSQPSRALVDTLNGLKQDGYAIAIDNYTGRGGHELLAIADIIKIDIQGRSEHEIEDLFHRLCEEKVLKIAKKVDNRESFQHLRLLGVDLYQGYFFAKPVNLRGRKPKSAEISKMRILQAIEDPQTDAETIKAAIEADPAITYRLLRLLNSASFGFSVKIESIKHAILLMGLDRLRYWLRMTIMSDLSKGPFGAELFIMGLNRGRFLEALAREEEITSAGPDTLFLFGMLSLIEPMLELPMKNIMAELPLTDGIKAGYIDSDSTYGKYLQLASAIENMDSKEIEQLCDQMHLDKKQVAAASKQSIEWATSMYQSMN